MTVRRTSFAIAVAAFLCRLAGRWLRSRRLRNPGPRPARVAVPRASRARAERDDAGTGEVRAPRRVERESGSQEHGRPSRERARRCPRHPAVATASDEQQGGARRRPGGSSASGGGRPSGGGGRPAAAVADGRCRSRPCRGRAACARPTSTAAATPSQRYARAVPRGRASHGRASGRPTTAAATTTARRASATTTTTRGAGTATVRLAGLLRRRWARLLRQPRVLRLYGGVYGPYGGAYYGGGYGAYGGPYGWSIGGVRLKVEPEGRRGLRGRLLRRHRRRLRRHLAAAAARRRRPPHRDPQAGAGDAHLRRA